LKRFPLPFEFGYRLSAEVTMTNKRGPFRFNLSFQLQGFSEMVVDTVYFDVFEVGGIDGFSHGEGRIVSVART
jgi:hypothetical protein